MKVQPINQPNPETSSTSSLNEPDAKEALMNLQTQDPFMDNVSSSSSSDNSSNSTMSHEIKELNPKKSKLHKKLPLSMVPETHVEIIGITKEQHTVKYGILVQTLHEEYVVYRRYSEFKSFRDMLIQAMATSTGCGDGPCRLLFGIKEYHFPRRRIQFRYRFDNLVVQERIFRLEYFLRIVLDEFKGVSKRNFDRCQQANCHVLNLVRAFLKLDGFGEPVAMQHAALLAYKQAQMTSHKYDQNPARDQVMKQQKVPSLQQQQHPQLLHARRKPKRDSPPVTKTKKPIAGLRRKRLYQSALYPIQEDFEMMFIQRSHMAAGLQEQLIKSVSC